MPVFVGQKVKLLHDGVEQEVFVKFKFPSLDDFPAAQHNVAKPCHIPKAYVSMRVVFCVTLFVGCH